MAMSRRNAVIYILLFLAGCFYTVHSTLTNDSPYVNLRAWSEGRERLPYQKRALLVPLIRAAEHNSRLARMGASHKGLGIFEEPANYVLFVIDFSALVGCGLLVTFLYRRASNNGALIWLPSTLLLMFFVITVGFRWEHQDIFPYDFLSMFLFSLGLYFIYRGWLWPLFVLMPIATYNRETTIMWVPLLLLAAWVSSLEGGSQRRRVMQLCITAAILLAAWVVITHRMAQPFLHNNAMDDYPRFFKNIRYVSGPKGLIQTISVFAFTLPFLCLYFRRIPDRLLRTFFYVVPLWFGVMFYQGEIIESRVFAELIPYVAVISVLIFESSYLPAPHDEAISR